MPRSNKLIELVFNDIVGNLNRVSAMVKFLETDKELGIKETEQLKKYKELYDKLVNKINFDLEELAIIEEIIVQFRCIEMIPKEIKFSLVREYIYARTTFYRSDNEIKDIRVIVGKVDDFDEPYETLIEYPEFIVLAQNKLRDAMFAETNKIEDEWCNVIEKLYEENLEDSK